MIKKHPKLGKKCIIPNILLTVFLFSCLFNIFIIPLTKAYLFSVFQNNYQSPKNININNLFMEPYLYPEEILLLYKYMDNSSVYFEFGSGGTTHQAAKRKLKIFTVEIGQCWVLQLQRDFEKIKSSIKNFDVDITYLVADIQNIINRSSEDCLKYIRMYNHTKYQADLILIDGKFNLACLMNVYKEIDNKTIIFFHQPENRDYQNVFEKYFDVVEKERCSFVLRKKSDNLKLSNNDLSRSEFQDIHFTNRLVDVMIHFKKNFNDLIEKYKNFDNSNAIKPNNKQIWIFWWQGLGKAPKIVKMCYQSVLKNFKDGNITIITQDNYKDYTNIPQIIIDKLNAKKFSLTHFSDIIRESVLSTRGGLWLDATIFVSSEIPSAYFENSFYTIHAEDNFFITFGKWCGFTQSSYINEVVTKFCCDFFYSYWSKFDYLYDYFLIDYVMLFGYENVPAFRKSVQSVPAMNQKFLGLERNFSDEYKPEKFNTLLNSSVFFKLSYKKQFKSQINGSILTNYGYFLEHFKE